MGFGFIWLSSWRHYFNGKADTSVIEINKITAQKSFVPSKDRQSVYVLDSFFSTISSITDGGAIYCNSVRDLMTESTTILECSTTANKGGAICYINNAEGHFVVNRVCSSKNVAKTPSIKGPSRGQFCNIEGNVKETNIDDSSIILSENMADNAEYTLFINSESASISRNNISGNKVYNFPSFGTSNLKLSFHMRYPTFAGNYAKNGYCMSFATTSTSCYINSANILDNKAQTLLNLDGNLNLEKTSIITNDIEKFVDIKQGKLSLTDCTIDFFVDENKNVEVKSTPETFNFNVNAHMNTQNCPYNYKYTVPVMFHIRRLKKCKYVYSRPNNIKKVMNFIFTDKVS